MAKRKGGTIIENSLLDPTLRNAPDVVAEYSKVKKEQQKVAKQAELEELVKAFNRIEAELKATPHSQRVRRDFLKRQKREAEAAIKTWQYLNGFA
jgi:hypothetical protein